MAPVLVQICIFFAWCTENDLLFTFSPFITYHPPECYRTAIDKLFHVNNKTVNILGFLSNKVSLQTQHCLYRCESFVGSENEWV